MRLAFEQLGVVCVTGGGRICLEELEPEVNGMQRCELQWEGRDFDDGIGVCQVEAGIETVRYKRFR